MKLKNTALTILTVVGLIAGTANKSEANDIVRENRLLASANIMLIEFAYREDYISRKHFDDGLEAIARLHKECRESLITCEESSENMEKLGEALVKNLSSQEIEEVKRLAVSEEFIPLVNEFLGY